MAIAFKYNASGDGNTILFKGSGIIAMDQDCCCRCGCNAGTFPTSIDVYFENCTGAFACLEGVTVNLPFQSGCIFGTDTDFCICESVWRVSVSISGGSYTVSPWYSIQIETSSTAADCTTNALGHYDTQTRTFSGTPFTTHNCNDTRSGTFDLFSLGTSVADFTITPVY